MNDIVHYTNCPVCGSAGFTDVFIAKDHTVSGESFLIAACPQCTLRFTQDVPGAQAIGRYYKSEDYISHTDTARGLVNRLYHFVRKRTLAKKRKLVQQATGLAAGRVLDLGCGTGAFVNEMKQAGWDAAGLEPDPDARKMAKQLYALDIGDTDQFYQLPAASIDAVTLWHVLEHVHDLHMYVSQLKNILKPGGRIFIAVPNYTSLDAAIYKASWAAYDVPRHLYHFSPGAIDTLMKKHGLQVRAYKPMWYDSFYISLLSSKYQSGKPRFLSACFNGLRSNLKTLGDVKRCSSVIYVIGREMKN